MSDTEQSKPTDRDFSPAIPLEISAEKAQKVDSILQKFAETAELETALVVHSSGCLVSGISSEADVTVEVISALVASASGALDALIRELGEAGKLESLHQGEERSVYFKALPRDFVLVGVSTAAIPVGQIREAARQNTEPLLAVLEELPEPEPVPVSEVPTIRKSLRPKPAAALAAEIPSDSQAHEESEKLKDESEPEDKLEAGIEKDVEPEKEPTEIIEVLGGDDPEIVIDGLETPFEAEEVEEEEDRTGEDSADLFNVGSIVTGSIFEIEEETEEEVETSSVFEEDIEDDEEEAPVPENIFEVDEDDDDASMEKVDENVPFELDEEAEETTAFETDEEKDDEDESDTAREAEAEESELETTEEEEVRSSGPFYF